ncbi:MAG: Flp pilus assembly complex ATPase component TadA, partial [Planctomycetes bacterium]|nr:Flp pilus assembly complex ATPase component TadA [Planctomycetota bacterium]
MSTPNDSNQPKKPGVPGTPANNAGKPAPTGQQGKPPVGKPAPGGPPAPGKPATPPSAGPKPGIPVSKPTAKPGAPAPKPAGTPPAAGKPEATPPSSPAKPAAPAGQGKPAAPAPKADGGAPKKPSDKPAVPASKHKPAPVRAGSGNRTTGRRLGQVLIDLGFLDDAQLWELLDEAKSLTLPLGQVAVSKGLITETQLMQALADQFGMKFVGPEELKPSPEALAAIPEMVASVYKVLPLTAKDGVVLVAIGDPMNLPGLDDLRNMQGLKEVTACLALPSAIAEVMTRCYLGKEESIVDIIASLNEDDDDDAPAGRETSIDLDKLIEESDAAPVRKLLNMVMLLAIKDRASDIHFEPFEDEYKLRYRCDGVMYEMVPPPRHLANAIATRIKVMSNLDIAERRLPQDGRIELNVGGNRVDMRVSIMPTMFGESSVIRVLDRGNVGLDLNRVGMQSKMLAEFRELIHKPNGIMLVTGPTGSGK